jgi:hypothetical protein
VRRSNQRSTRTMCIGETKCGMCGDLCEAALPQRGRTSRLMVGRARRRPAQR